MTKLSTLFPAVSIRDGYSPALMNYISSNFLYDASESMSGNVAVLICRFRMDVRSGTTDCYIVRHSGGANSRISIIRYASGDADADKQDRIRVYAQNSSGTIEWDVYTEKYQYQDGELHSMFVEIDAGAGTAQFLIDGEDADDTTAPDRVALSGTFTLANGSGIQCIGDGYTGFGSLYLGELGYLGISNQSGLDYYDFFNGDNSPKKLDETSWTEWGSQPYYWNEHGDLASNQGSAANLARNGSNFNAPHYVVRSGFNPYPEISPVDSIKLGLHSFWAMDEAGAATRVDTMSSGNDLSDNGGNNVGQGTLLGVTAADFTNVTSNSTPVSNLVSVLSTNTAELSNKTVCIGGWFEPDILDAGHILFARADNDSNAADDACWNLWINTSDQLEFHILYSNAVEAIVWPGTIAVDVPHFVVAYIDTANLQIGLSVDGGAYQTLTITGIPDTDGLNLQVGRRGFTSGWKHYFGGRMARWGWWTRPLHIKEVEYAYNNGIPRPVVDITG